MVFPCFLRKYSTLRSRGIAEHTHVRASTSNFSRPKALVQKKKKKASNTIFYVGSKYPSPKPIYNF